LQRHSTRTTACDQQAILAALRLILEPGQVTELRALDAVTAADRRPHVEAGYFDTDHLPDLAAAVATIRSAKGIYITPNPVNPALLARAANRIRPAGKEPLTSDHDVLRRRWLLIDVDPARPAGISASEAEHAAALDLARKIVVDLSTCGWPSPILADSGNGAHLLYRIDLAVDDGERVKHTLEALAARYDNEVVAIDTTVHNPARIWKLYGTRGCKGDSTPDRPHRLARIVEAPAELHVVPIELMQALAGEVAGNEDPAPQQAQRSNGEHHGGLFDLERWIADRGLDLAGPTPWQGGRRWKFNVCPWNQDHANGSAYIVQQQNGAIAAGCHHNGCADKGWHNLRDVVEPGWRDRHQQSKRERPASVEVVPWRPFPIEALPEPIGSYVGAAAKAMGCDASFVALPLLAALAASIGNTRRVRLKSGWCEPSILWAAIVGDSGTLKSPAYRLATSILKRKQKEALDAYQEAVRQHQQELLAFQADVKAWQGKGRKAGEPPPEAPPDPVPQRYIVSDTTVEALADRLQVAPRGLLLAVDELSGWLQGFAQYKGGKGNDTAHWLSMFHADLLLVDRKTGPQKTICVERAAVSIAGGIQPQTLRHCLGREHFDNGLAARLLLAYPPRLPKRWTEATVDDDLTDRVAAVFDGLLALDFTQRDGKTVPLDLPLTAAAKSAWVRFYNEHAAEQAELTGELAAAWSKLEAYAPRLALVDHCVRVAAGDTTVDRPEAIDRVSIEAGIALARWFGIEARRVYGVLAESDEDRHRRELVELIGRKGGRITARELRQSCRQFRGNTDAAWLALNDLVKARLGAWASASTAPKGGRPTQVFYMSTVYQTPQNRGKQTGFVDVDTESAPENGVCQWTG
jgi:hypothetical protein